MKRICLTALLAVSAVVSACAQTYQQAIDLLKENKRSEARAALKKLEADEKDGAKASLALSLMDAEDEHFPEGFRHFKAFFDGSSNPYPYVYAMSTSGIFSGGGNNRDRQVKAFFQQLLQDPDANASIKGFAAEQLAGRMVDEGDVAEGKELYRSLADVGPWSTVGVFENVSGSGFGKDFGVLSHPDNAAVFTNKTGAKVSWFDVPAPRNARWWDFEYQHDISNSIIYAQTFLNSDADRDVIMMVGVSGSVKVWLNDFLVGSESEERNTDNDVYNYTVKLQKGTNRILLQIGASEIDNANYMVRFADTGGRLLTGLTASPHYTAYAKAQPYEVKQIPFFAETFFEKKTEKNPGDLIAQLLLLKVYNHNDKRYEARKVAARLKAMAPHSTLIEEALVDALTRDKNFTDVTKEMESIKTNDPESLYGLVLRYNDAESREDWDECSRLLKKRISLYGENEDTKNKELDLLSRKKESEKVVSGVAEAYKQYPNSSTYALLQYIFVANTSKDMRAAGNILRDYLSHNYNLKVSEVLIENDLKTGQVNDAIRMYKKLINDQPYAIGYYTKLADIYYETKDYKSALEWEQKAMDLAPYIGSLYYSKGLIYDAMNNKSDAKEMMRKAVYYAPTNYAARKKLRILDGKKDLFENFKANDAEAIYKRALADNKTISDNAIFLLNDKQQVVYPENGAVEEHGEYLIRVINQTGVDDYKEISIPYNGYTQRLIIEKAELFKKDGSKVQAESNDNQLVFSTLEKGDALHISYRLENSYYGKLAEHFWDDFHFNGGSPEQTARYSLIVPAARKFQYKVYNTKLDPVITDVDNEYKMYVWEKKDVPAMEPEPYMPATADVGEKLVFTSIPDWNYVANWYSDLSGAKAKADFEVKEKVKELLAGNENKPALEKAKIIYDYIEQNFHYSNVPFLHSALTPQRASRTLSTRLGDCKDLSTLFVAMCKEAGLTANLVLVDTRDNGDNNLDLPTIGFNHCIAQLQSGNKYYLVELTDNHLPFGAMGFQLINANGLYIPKENEIAANAGLVKLNSPLRMPNNNDRQSTVELGNGKASIRRLVYKTGSEASESRSGYIDTKQEDRVKDLNNSLSSEFNKSVKVERFDLKNIDNLEDTVVLDYRFTVDNFTSEIVGMQVFKLPWAESFRSVDFVALDNRKYPLTIHSLSATPVEKEVMTIKLPAGRKLAEMPKNISLKGPVMTYDITYTVKPDRVVVTREVKYLQDHVSPEDYPAFKAFITKLNEADNRQMAIK